MIGWVILEFSNEISCVMLLWDNVGKSEVKKLQQICFSLHFLDMTSFDIEVEKTWKWQWEILDIFNLNISYILFDLTYSW